ncbi:MAG: NAD(P)/FAD-dependent oxidoreductase [Myxococcales bacterium]|nr:NAD(P)/FAD-dependent oxidoreductase [Myxococcales bacterium]
MPPQTSANQFDVIVIGSGMGGMTTAAALSRFGHRVLLLEQAPSIGGLTHSFSHDGFTWDVGLHYCGMLGHDQEGGRILDWLSGGTIEFRSAGTVYDTLHFPDGFDVPVGRPAEAYKMELKERFPDNTAEIDAYFEAQQAAKNAARLISIERSMPQPDRAEYRRLHSGEIEQWCGRTTSQVISEFISEPKLAAILAARWGTFGGKPKEASFGIHALIMWHYLDGASYPLGGGAAIAKGLVPVIESAGGSARAATPIDEIVVEGGRAVGVRTSSGEVFRAPVIVSAMGAGGTVKRLLPAELREQAWAAEIRSFKPAISHFELSLGFEGDIARHGARRSNDWFYESWNTDDGIWSIDGPIPMMFVSFPSLKDPTRDPGPSQRHTGQCMVFTEWSSVAEFAEGGARERPAEWAAFKKRVESKILAHFEAKFPALAPWIVHHELSTPLATVRFTTHEKGGFYGVEPTPRRMLSDALSARTPVPGLFLTGQDILTPGIAGALFSGMLCAAAIEPRVYEKLS